MPKVEPKIFEVLLIFAWFVRTLGSTFSLLALFQLKEYRFDRIRVHLTTTQGKILIFNFMNILKWLLLFSFPVIFFLEKYRFAYPYMVATVFIIEVLSFNKQAIFKELKKPIFTLKAKLLSLISVSFQLLILIFAFKYKHFVPVSDLNFVALVCLLLDRTLAVFLSLSIVILKPLTILSKKWLIRKAIIKIRSLPTLKIIGITGSYGKTSTKEFLTTILSSKFKVLKTEGSINTDIGIAQTILSRLKKEHGIFIVEMGAYKLGEIKAMCEIVHPQVGILTAVGEQHLSIFKSKENILRAKLELINSLPDDGLAVLNGDSERVRTESLKLKKRKVFFGHLNKEVDIKACDIVVAKRRLRFAVVRNGEEAEFEVPLLGRHNITNILASTLVAQEFNLSLLDVAKAVRKIKPAKKTLEPQKGLHGSTFIDDTFNANPEGLEAALRYLNETDWHQRILVLQPLIELGEASERAHMKLASLMANICDKVYFTNTDYKKFLLSGFEQSKKKTQFIWLKNRKQIASEIHNALEKHDVVLFEGKESARVLKYLKEHKYA